MKSSKSGNHMRAVAFFLIALVLIFTVGFAAGGWQSLPDKANNSGDVDDTSNNTDENKDDTNTELPDEPDEPTVHIPEFTDYLTGLEVSETHYKNLPKAFLLNPSYPLYGISSASLIIEIPTEASDTRLITYISDPTLPTKIGALAPTRKYIDNLVKYFGGLCISYGSDDSMKYDGLDISTLKFDLSERGNYFYTEYTYYAYTNRDLIESGVESYYANTESTIPNMPYVFPAFDSEGVIGAQKANSIVIPFSSTNETEFTYSLQDGKYVFSKNGQQKRDLLNDSKLSYTNVFILFADAVTYETATASELILDTISGGSGIYFTGGTYQNFSWTTDTEGNLLFYKENGDILTVNRGTSYIGFMKSSRTGDITIA